MMAIYQIKNIKNNKNNNMINSEQDAEMYRTQLYSKKLLNNTHYIV